MLPIESCSEIILALDVKPWVIYGSAEVVVFPWSDRCSDLKTTVLSSLLLYTPYLVLYYIHDFCCYKGAPIYACFARLKDC